MSSAEAACALPNSLKKLSLSWVPNGGEVMKLLRVATSSGSIVCFWQRQGCYSLLSSSGSPKSSSNTIHLTLSEYVRQQLDFNVMVSLVTRSPMNL